MAQKRMFDKIITNSDEFMEMPDSSQMLYFHLSMNADDDGFVNNWKSIMRMTGKKEDDLKILIAKQFVIPFETGVIVIKHWRINNYLRNDRYTATKFTEEKKLLSLDENMVYQLDTDGIHRLDKNRLDKISIDNNILPPAKKEIKHKYGEYKNVLLTDEQLDKLKVEFPNDYEKRIQNVDDYVQSTGKKYKDFLAVIRTWAKKENNNITYKNKKYERMSLDENWN